MARLTNDLNSSSHSNLSSHANAGDHPNFTVNQLRNESLSEGFSKQASDYHSLAAMSLGSLTFSSIRSLSTPLFSALFRSSTAVQSATWVTALGAEVGAFRASNQVMSEAGSSESWHDARAFTGTAMDFALLKGFSHFLHAESFVTRHSVSANAMVAGELAREATHLSDETHKTFSERFSHALVSSVALEAGSHLSRMATGGALQVFERNMQRGIESNLSGNSERRQNEATHHGFANLQSMRANQQSPSRNFEIEGRRVTLRIEGDVSAERAAELQDQVRRALQGELVFELAGIADEIVEKQERIYRFMPGRETIVAVRANGEIRSLQIMKDGREVSRLGEVAASPTPVEVPARPAAPVEAARLEVPRPAERTVERVVERPAERIEEPAWARQSLEDVTGTFNDFMSVRAAQALANAGVKTYGELLRCDENTLLDSQAARQRGGTSGVGRIALRQIKNLLDRNHLALGMTDAEIAAIPDLSTPREVINDSASGRKIVRVVARPVEEVTARPVAAAAAAPTGDIPITLMTDFRCQGKILTLNGFFTRLIASNAEWSAVREAARELLTESARTEALEFQLARLAALTLYIENPADSIGPADVLRLIGVLKSADTLVKITNARKSYGSLVGRHQQMRAVVPATVAAAAAPAAEEATPVVAAFQAPAAAAVRDERIEARPIERVADEEAGQKGGGRREDGGSEEERRDEEAERRGTVKIPTSTDVTSRFERIRQRMEQILQTQTPIVGGTLAGARKASQSKSLKGIEDANLLPPQKIFLLEQFERALDGESTLEAVSKLRDRLTGRSAVLAALDKLSRKTTWTLTYACANRVFHKILLLETDAYRAAITRFQQIIENPKSPSNEGGLGKFPMLSALRRLEKGDLTAEVVAPNAAVEPARVAEPPAAPVAAPQPVAEPVVEVSPSANAVESKTRGDIRNLAATFPTELRARIDEIIDLIDTTYEIENVRRNPQLVVEAGEALPDKEGALRFAIARKKGRVDLNFKTTLEQCRELSNIAILLMLEMQRKAIERKIDSGELTRLRDRINSTEMLNGHMKNLEAREGLDAAEWTPVIDLLAQSYRRVILEVDKHSFFRTAGRFIDIAEAFTSRSPQDIIPRLQKLLATEDIGLAVRELFEGLAITAAPVAAAATVEAKPARLSPDEATAIRELTAPRGERLQRVLREFIEAADDIFEHAEAAQTREFLEKAQEALRLLNELAELVDVEACERRLGDIFQIVINTRDIPTFWENLDNYIYAYRRELGDAQDLAKRRPVTDERAEAISTLREEAAPPAPVADAPRVEARVETIHAELNETQRGLCERLSRPYNIQIANEAKGLLNAGEAWASVLSITLRIIEKITSAERFASVAGKLFLVLRLRTKNTPEFVQGKLEALERELNPPSGPTGSDGAPPAPPAPPSPPPPPTASPVGVIAEGPAMPAAPRLPVPVAILEREAAPRVGETSEGGVERTASSVVTAEVIGPNGEREVVVTCEVSVGETSDAVPERIEFGESLGQVAEAVAALSPLANSLKGLWKRLLRAAIDTGEAIRGSEEISFQRRSAALRQLKTILDAAREPQTQDPQILVDRIETLKRDFLANPERFDAAANTRALPADTLQVIQRELTDIIQNAEAIDGNPHQRAQVRARTAAILHWLESEQGPQNPAEVLELVQRILALRTLDRHDYNAQVIGGYLDVLERGLRSHQDERITTLRQRLDACYDGARAPEPAEAVRTPLFELSNNEIKRRLFGEANLQGLPSIIKNFYGRFQSSSRQGLVYLLMFGSSRSVELCRNLFTTKQGDRLYNPDFARRAIRFFELISSIAHRLTPADRSLVEEVESFTSIPAMIDSDFMDQLERRAASSTGEDPGVTTPLQVPLAPEREIVREPIREVVEKPATVVVTPARPAVAAVPTPTIDPLGYIEREISRAIPATGPAREAYKRLSVKAQQGLASLVRDCADPVRRDIIKRLFENHVAQTLREGNYLTRLFECIDNCYLSPVRQIYQPFVPRHEIAHALNENGIELEKRLNSILAEYEMAAHYAQGKNVTHVILGENFSIRLTSLNIAQRKYLLKLDPLISFREEYEASPDLLVVTSSTTTARARYLVEVKNSKHPEFNPTEEQIPQILKQVFKYAVVRNDYDVRITHAEFVVLADEINPDFVVLFEEACRIAELPYVLYKHTRAGRRETVSSSFTITLTPESPPATTIAVEAPTPAAPVAPAAPTPAPAPTSAPLAAATAVPPAIEAAISDAASGVVRKNPTPEAIRWINDILPSGVALRGGMNRKDTVSAGRDSFEVVNKREFLTDLSQAVRARGDLPAAQRAELDPLLQRMQNSLGDKRFTVTFINDLLDAALILTEERTSDSEAADSNGTGPSASDLALQTLAATPSLINNSLARLAENLDVIEGHPTAFGVEDLAGESPDLPFAAEMVGAGITLRGLHEAIQASTQLRRKVGDQIAEGIAAYLNRYEALSARLQTRSEQSASEAPTE